MCTSSEGTGVRNGAAKVSRFSRPNHIHTKVRIRWISHALPSYKDDTVLRKYITNTNELLGLRTHSSTAGGSQTLAKVQLEYQ